MEAFIKLRRILPCGIRFISMKQTAFSQCERPSVQDQPEQVQSPPPFSRDGDSGCSLVNGKLLPKDDRIFHAIGNTDELSSYLGVAQENAIKQKLPYVDKLTRIQTMLVDIVLAIGKQDKQVAFPPQNTKELEEWILQYSKELTPAENYLLPGGGKTSTSLHVARCVCRRAERSVLPLVNEGQLDKEVQIYFNRLADLLLTWARYAAKQDERSEAVYTPKSEAKKNQTTDSRNKPTS